MIRNAAILVSLIALAAGYTWYDGTSQQRAAANAQKVSRAAPEQSAPDFGFVALDGKERKLSDFQGKAIILNFWASWCAPCVIEFPQMVRLAKAQQKNAVFLFLSQDEDDAAMKAFLKKYASDLPDNVFVARDTDKTIAQDLYQTFKLPETYLINPDLHIEEKIIGNPGAWDGDAMQRKITSLAE